MTASTSSTSTILSLLPPPPSLLPNMTSITTSTTPSPAAIDALLGSLPLASLQLLEYCCSPANQTTNSDPGIVTSTLSLSSPTTNVDCLWPTNPALLCDRFHLLPGLTAVNLTSAANYLEDSILPATAGDSSMWSTGAFGSLSSGSASVFPPNSDLFSNDQASSYLSPSKCFIIFLVLIFIIIF